ncbi:MAG TPA: thrombospondin type 3 repeat-containing protein, partial [Polyangiaceae bacterium]|nr:thrombospondin type 3 repeat-containing protein [Polyangiaceae bacterium]
GTQCEADLVAKINLDYHLAALQLASGTLSPAQYLAISRDRTRKRSVAQPLAELCNMVNADTDGDLVPNARDACPNTPALTPTKDNGCTDTTLPSAPPASDVSKALGKITLLGSKYCQGAPAPTVPTFLKFAPFLLGWHDLVLAHVGNQPAGCPVYYHIQVESLDITTNKTKSLSTMFQDTESMDPSTAPTVTFRVAGGSDPNRTNISNEIYGAAYSDPTNIRFVRARAMATSGAGARSDWSQWSSWY